MKTNESLDTLVENVQANSKYQHIYRGFVERLAQEAIKKGMKGKAAGKINPQQTSPGGRGIFPQANEF